MKTQEVIYYNLLLILSTKSFLVVSKDLLTNRNLNTKSVSLFLEKMA